MSMGSVSARKLGLVVENTRNALAIEIMTAAAGLDQRAPLVPSTGVAAALAKVREHVAKMVADRPLYEDIAAVAGLLSERQLVAAVESKVGPLA